MWIVLPGSKDNWLNNRDLRGQAKYSLNNSNNSNKGLNSSYEDQGNILYIEYVRIKNRFLEVEELEKVRKTVMCLAWLTG